jgi:hypothetical protein
MTVRAAFLPARWLLLAASSWLAACSGAHESAQVATSVARVGTTATTNVPALVGMSIDDLHRRLGLAHTPPASLTDPSGPLAGQDEHAMQDSIVSFQTGGLTLVASYDIHTRQVRDLLLLGHHEDSLMARAALRSNASSYLVLPVFRVDKPSSLLGLRIVATK